mmetsp:Transcript_19534/g.44104  ORF Transcript_19534/g.44104 Transcript_19534/m.44104 type:complete len:240 (-) Transcript_19534:167-886(-)
MSVSSSTWLDVILLCFDPVASAKDSSPGASYLTYKTPISSSVNFIPIDSFLRSCLSSCFFETFFPSSDDLSSRLCLSFLFPSTELPKLFSSSCLYNPLRSSFCFLRRRRVFSFRWVCLKSALAALVSSGVRGGNFLLRLFFFFVPGKTRILSDAMPANCSRSSGDSSDSMSPPAFSSASSSAAVDSCFDASATSWPLSARPRFQVCSDCFSIASSLFFSLSSAFVPSSYPVFFRWDILR